MATDYVSHITTDGVIHTDIQWAIYLSRMFRVKGDIYDTFNRYDIDYQPMSKPINTHP